MVGIAFFVVTHARIYCIVSKMKRRVSCRSAPVDQNSSEESTMKISVLIVFAFVVSYLPVVVYSVFKLCQLEGSYLRTNVFHCINTLRMMNCLTNAVFYYWRLKDLRKASLMLLAPYCCKKINHEQESYIQQVTITQSKLPEYTKRGKDQAF